MAACSLAPEFQRPEIPVPLSLTQTERGSTAVAVAAAQAIDWRTFFRDPQLQALIASALEYNRDLRIAAARVEEARAQFSVVRADRLPGIGLTTTGSSTKSVAELGGTGKTGASESYETSLSMLSFEVDFWGRLANLSDAARLNYLASQEARRSVHLSLIVEVASAYFSLLHIYKTTEFAHRVLELREHALALIQKGVAAGGIYDYEYQQARSLVEAARSDMASLEHQKNVALNRLRFLIGTTSIALPQNVDFDVQGMNIEVAPDLPSDVLLLRPDVMAAEQRLRASHINIGAARAAFFPKILLTAGLGLASQGLTALYSSGMWVFQPSLALPLFDNGRTAAGVDVAQARKVIAVAEYEKTIQAAFREVSDLLSSRTSLARQIQAASVNLEAQRKRLQMIQARYDTGLISYLDVLDSQREFIAAQQIVLQIRRAQVDTSAQLYKALGGSGPSDV